MKTENNNIIFTVLNKNLLYTLGIIWVISIIMVILFFTKIKAELIVLGLPFVFFLFVLPIFMIGMRNKIIYRFTSSELQFRGKNIVNIKWKDIKSFNRDNSKIILHLNSGENINLPVFNFDVNELEKALSIYIK